MKKVKEIKPQTFRTREVYFYTCQRCLKKRLSFKIDRAKKALCTICKKLAPGENQLSLIK